MSDWKANYWDSRMSLQPCRRWHSRVRNARILLWTDEQREQYRAARVTVAARRGKSHIAIAMKESLKHLKSTPAIEPTFIIDDPIKLDLHKHCQKVNAPSVEQMAISIAEKVNADREAKIWEGLATGQRAVIFHGPHWTELIDLRFARLRLAREENKNWIKGLEPLTDEQKADAAERVCTTPFRERPVDVEPVKERLFPVHFYIGGME